MVVVRKRKSPMQQESADVPPPDLVEVDMPDAPPAAIGHLEELPAELLSHIASMVLAAHLPNALRFCAASHLLQSTLHAVRAAAEAQRYVQTDSYGRTLPSRWLEEHPDTDGFA